MIFEMITVGVGGALHLVLVEGKAAPRHAEHAHHRHPQAPAHELHGLALSFATSQALLTPHAEDGTSSKNPGTSPSANQSLGELALCRGTQHMVCVPRGKLRHRRRASDDGS